MLKKKLTFMLIPSSTGISKQMSIPTAAIYISVAAVVCLLCLSFFLSAEYFAGKVNENELEQLRAENKSLLDKYEQMRWNMAEVENRYSDLVKKEVTIRSLFDLPAVDEGERQLGIGGPSSPHLESMSPLRKAAYATEVEVDRLLKLSKFELEKYGEVEQSLNNIKDRLAHTPSIWPTKGWKSRGFGMKHDPFTGYKQMHRGIDIANHTGTPIIATADGVVRGTGRATGMGKLLTIDHGYGFKTRYGHLSEIKVKNGQRVKRGDVIALMGSTGYSTGPHLHYEVIRNGQFFNPMKYILNDM